MASQMPNLIHLPFNPMRMQSTQQNRNTISFRPRFEVYIFFPLALIYFLLLIDWLNTVSIWKEKKKKKGQNILLVPKVYPLNVISL